MITKIIKRRIVNGTGPYTYTWSSNLSCASFVVPNGTTTRDVISTVNYDTAGCIDNAVFTLRIVDAEGCETFETITDTNPCENFTLNPITFQPPSTFIASSSFPGCSSVTYEWQWDTMVFNSTPVTRVDSPHSSSITLALSNSGIDYPMTTPISVKAKGCNNCELTESYTHSICTPVALDLTVNMYCDETGTFYSAPFEMPMPIGCSSTVIDWSTLQFGPPTGFTLLTTHLGLPLPNRSRKLVAVSSIVPGTYSIPYSVRTTDGIISTSAAIHIVVHVCDNTGFYIPNATFSACGIDVGDYLNIPLSDKIIKSSTIELDWGTWEVFTNPAYLSENIQVSFDVFGNPIMGYQVPDTELASDTFMWTICASNGQCAMAGTYTVILSCPAAPTAVDDEACAVCGTPVTFSVLGNDIAGDGVFVNSSIQIETPPTKGVVINAGSGNLTYTPNSGQTGVDTFTYTVANTSGQRSEPATVTIEITCAGNDAQFSVCN